LLPLIKRRLLASEREELASGQVYVWEEAQDEGGLLRWTDGRRWSQSRMRGDYLFYEEKVETTQEERDAKAARRARRAADPNASVPMPTRRKDRPSKPNGLTKQTYSVAVHLPGTIESRKWHVVAYFSGNDYANLPVIESYDYLRNIRVPQGVFLSSKSLTGRIDRFSYHSDDSEAYDESSHSPVHSAFMDYPPSRESPASSGSSSSSATSPAGHYIPLLSARPNDPQKIILPPITTLARSHPRAHRTEPSPVGTTSGGYGRTARTSHDCHTLNKFSLGL